MKPIAAIRDRDMGILQRQLDLIQRQLDLIQVTQKTLVDGQNETTRKVNQIMATQAEDAQTLRDLKTQLGKANDEIQAKIQALVDAAAKADVTPELQAAIDDLKPAAQQLDDIVPDVTPTP